MSPIRNLSPGTTLSEPLVAQATSIDRTSTPQRNAEVVLTGRQGHSIDFVDYVGAETEVSWMMNCWYQIENCAIQRGRGPRLRLSPSKRTVVTELGQSTTDTARLLVVGDTHIGRQRHPKTGIRIDPLAAFQAATTYGIEQQVDAVVHVGDIFHDTASSLSVKHTSDRVFRPLRDAGIPFYYVRGNHGSDAGAAALDALAGTNGDHLDTSGVRVTPQIRLFGLDHSSSGAFTSRDLRFPAAIEEPISILICHQTLAQISGRGSQAVDLEAIGARFTDQFDIVFAGHHHDATIATWGRVPVVYTGACERMSTNNNPVDRVAWMVSVTNGVVSFEQYDIP